MIETFTSNRRSNKKYTLLQWAIFLLIATIFPFYKILYLHSSVNSSYYLIVGASFIVALFREIFEVHITEIVFNSEEQQIFYRYEKLFTKVRQSNIPYHLAKLEIATSFGWRRDKMAIHFFCDRHEEFKLDQYKDGFSQQTLERIRDLAQKLSLPEKKY